jgi:Ni/Fe-hydrogenase subunit HybB-like protein
VVLRTLEPPGALYFAWMSVIGLLLTAGILAWTYQIWAGLGTTGLRVRVFWGVVSENSTDAIVLRFQN